MLTLSSIRLTRNPTSTSGTYPVFVVGIQQWGVSTKDINTYTINVIYAKQFELFCRPIAIPYLANTSIDSSARLAISSVTNSKFIFMTDTSSITTQAIWFVAGVQQWGLLSTETVNFQIPFDMVFCAFAITKNNVALTDAGATIPALSVSTATMYVNGLNGYWLVVGAKNKQQWRMLEIEATEQNVLFPIPFIQWCVASGSRVTGTGGNPTTLGANAAFHQIATLTHAAVFSVEAQEYYLFAAGVQQWGYYFESQSDADYRYLPITYTTHYCVALGNITYAPNESETGYAPYYQEVSNSVFLVGLGNNRIGNANVPVITVGIQQWGYSPYNAEDGLVSIALQLSSSEIISVCSQQIARSATDKNGTQQVLFVSFDETTINFRIVNTEASTDTAISFYWFGLFKQQWGSLSNWSTGPNSYTYPIAFSERTYSLAYSITTVRESAVAIYNATKTEFTYSTNAASTSVGISVIFLGKQQWGYEITFTAKTIVFPCPYAEIIPSVIGASSGSSAKLAINANSLTSFNASNQAAQTIWWIAIGKQQWGTEPGVGTYEYPIPYTALCYGVITNRQVKKSNNATTAVDITLTEFTCSKSDGMGDYSFNWLSAGV